MAKSNFKEGEEVIGIILKVVWGEGEEALEDVEPGKDRA